MTRVKWRAPLTCLFLLASSGMAAAAPAAAPPSAHEAQAKSIEKLLTAPCCYKGTLEDHTSSVASQMRQEIRDLLAKGRTKAQILAYYKKKYGQAILVEPPKGGLSGFLLYGIPFGLAILGLLVMTTLMARRKRREDAEEASAEQKGDLPAEMEARIDALVAGKATEAP